MIYIEEFQPKYKEQVIDLILEIQQKEFSIPISEDDQPDLQCIETIYQTQGGGFWLAVDCEQVIGTVGLIALGKHIGALRKMFVDHRFRGRQHSVAQRLLSALIEHCKANHIRSVFLGTISKYKAAMRFYEKNGFVELRKSHLPEEFPVMEVDDVFYKLEVK